MSSERIGNLISKTVTADDLIHVLQGGRLAFPSLGIVLEPDVPLYRAANKVRTREHGGTRVARADGGGAARLSDDGR